MSVLQGTGRVMLLLVVALFEGGGRVGGDGEGLKRERRSYISLAVQVVLVCGVLGEVTTRSSRA